MTTDIEARLEHLAVGGHPDERRPRVGDGIFREVLGRFVLMKSEIAALKAQLAEAREALKPFGSLPALPLSISVSVWASDINRAAEVLKKMEKANG